MDWSSGFSACYYVTLVDPVTWRDLDRVEITEGSISRTGTGLRQSADLTCTDFTPESERWIRVWMDAAQPGSVAHVALFTGLTSVSEQDINGVVTRLPLSCYSVLKPAADIPLEKGAYVAANMIGADVVQELLSATPAPVVIESASPRLSQAIVAEGGETRLSMADRILSAINWRLRIDGDGTIHIGAWDGTERAVFGLNNDVITPSVKLRADWFSCPNVFRATCGDAVAMARDDDPSSYLSTVNRGREIWEVEDNVTLSSDESLQQYATRRLRELQSFAYAVSYSRRFDPAVNVTDVIRLHYPRQGMMGLYTVASQRISLGHGATVSEEVQR